jgi:prepilin-type N-terminal cleavage/methylation domain-containing protein
MKANETQRSAPGRGFTLIELMIVVAIVGMLAAISVPVYSQAVRRARVTALAADVDTLYGALMRYHVDHGAFPAEKTFDRQSLAPLTSEGYLADAGALTEKLVGSKLYIYVAPDVGGPDQHFIVVTRHVLDPSIIVVAAHTNIVGAAGGWIDGVYVITDGELQEAGDLSRS